MQKHAFLSTKIITPFIYHVSLSQKISYAKKKDMGYAEKKEKKKEKCPCQKAWEKKMHAKEHEEKKRKRKK